MKTLCNISSLGIFLLLLVFSSCAKEDIKEEKDACEGIYCYNDGVCIDGACDCTERYTGPDCRVERDPKYIIVSNIRVTRFPAFDTNGIAWDSASNPDISILIYDPIDPPKMSSVIWDANPSLQHDFPWAVTLKGISRSHTITLSERDDPNEGVHMGSISFIPWVRGNLPQKIILDEGGEIAFELTVTYEW